MANGKRPQAILGMLAPTIEAIVEPTEEDIARFRREGKKLTQQELAKFDNPDPFRDETSIFSGIPTFTDPVTGELSEAKVQEAVTLAASMPIASAALGFRIPQGAVGIFGGVGAKTAPKEKLKQAIVMESGGSSRKEILAATGWSRGVDGKWKFEISDESPRVQLQVQQFESEALKRVMEPLQEVEDALLMLRIADGLGFKPTAATRIAEIPDDIYENARKIFKDIKGREFPRGQIEHADLGDLENAQLDWMDAVQEIQQGEVRGLLPNLIRHPDLFEAYPELKQAQARLEDLPPGMSGQALLNESAVRIQKDMSDQNILSTLLHEIQHLIQSKEGFAIGANVEHLQRIMDHKSRLRLGISSAKAMKTMKGTASLQDPHTFSGQLPITKANADDYIEDAQKMLKELEEITPSNDAYENYRRAAGEVEARNVQKRRRMFESERRGILPEKTEDVPRERQTVTFRGD